MKQNAKDRIATQRNRNRTRNTSMSFVKHKTNTQTGRLRNLKE